MTDALWRTIGAAGSAALLARAFARTEEEHLILRELRANGDTLRVDGIATSVDAHGIEAVTDARCADPMPSLMSK